MPVPSLLLLLPDPPLIIPLVSCLAVFFTVRFWVSYPMRLTVNHLPRNSLGVKPLTIYSTNFLRPHHTNPRRIFHRWRFTKQGTWASSRHHSASPKGHYLGQCCVLWSILHRGPRHLCVWGLSWFWRDKRRDWVEIERILGTSERIRRGDMAYVRYRL